MIRRGVRFDPPAMKLRLFLMLMGSAAVSWIITGCATPKVSPSSSSAPSEIAPSVVPAAPQVALSLHSPMLAKKWKVVEEDGEIRYIDPKLSLIYFGIRRVSGPSPVLANPPLVIPIGYGMPMSDDPREPYKQKWKSSRVVGQTVRWYQQDEGSGADFPSYLSEHFAITTRSGQKEYYQIFAGQGMEQKNIREIDQMIASIKIR